MVTPQILPAGADGVGNGSWERTLDTASAGIHKKIDKLADTAHPAVDQLSSGAHKTVDKVSDAAARTAKAVAERSAQLKEVHGQVMAETRMRVRDKPLTAMAIAAGVGFLLSYLFRLR